MTLRFLMVLLFTLPALAQDDTPGDIVVALRITSAAPGGAVVVDRGSRDGLANGDRIRFTPRGGGSILGTVIEVRERDSIVKLDDPRVVADPGLPGEVRVPETRLAEPSEGADEKAREAVPDHAPWEYKDENWKPGKPLLTEVGSVKPRNRAPMVTGRAYLAADLTAVLESDYTNSFLRTGTDLNVSNPFRKGGVLRINFEAAYLTERDDADLEPDFLVRRLAYVWGGTRFHESRWELGRFLQYGMPEFGVLDGIEWSRRRASGHSFGFTAGFLPETDEDFETFEDFQFSGYYRWVSGPNERLSIRGGFQKTWHGTSPDRDLLIAALRFLPEGGWDFDATAWVDFYSSSDDYKNDPVELTFALVSLRRRWESGSGFDLNYRHQRFPDIDRNEFIPPLPEQVTNDRYDRLGLTAWHGLGATRRIHGHASLYNDEDGTGGAGDLGFEWNDLILDRSRLGVTLFVTIGAYEDVYGGRIAYSKFTRSGSWDFLYDVAEHRLAGINDDQDDLIQHRLRVSGTFFVASTWDISCYAETTLYDEEISWSIGFNLQKRF